MEDHNKIILKSLEIVANHATKGEIASFNRKRKAIDKLITNHISPLEDSLLETNAKLIPLYDTLNTQRNEMVAFCIHPIDMLIYKDSYIECKFCNAKLGVPHVDRTEE